jgi:hypothetical protein
MLYGWDSQQFVPTQPGEMATRKELALDVLGLLDSDRHDFGP